jgi:hypothetical protein
MTSIIESIQERYEAVLDNLHTGFYPSSAEGALIMAAEYCLNLNPDDYPHSWPAELKSVIKNYSLEERLTLAAALCAGELQRLKIKPAPSYGQSFSPTEQFSKNKKPKK